MWNLHFQLFIYISNYTVYLYIGAGHKTAKGNDERIGRDLKGERESRELASRANGKAWGRNKLE